MEKEHSQKKLQTILPGNVFTSDTGQLIRNTLNGDEGAVYLNDFHRKLFQDIQDAGKLQTSATGTLNWTQHFRRNYIGQPFIIMDGSPRRRPELLEVYEDLIESYHCTVIFVYIHVTDAIAIQHMQERHKITPREETSSIEKIMVRLQQFNDLMSPTMQFIKAMQGVNLKEISNNESLAEFEGYIESVMYETLTEFQIQV